MAVKQQYSVYDQCNIKPIHPKDVPFVITDQFSFLKCYYFELDVEQFHINGSQLAKMKKYIPHNTCPCHEIYRVVAVGLKNTIYTLKNYYFCEYVKIF